MPEMTVQEAAEWGKTLDFTTVWATLTKLGEKIEKTTENVNNLGDKVEKTTETVNRMAEKVERVSENVGGLNRSVGELIETLVAARLWEKFPEYDLKRAYQRLPLYDEKNVQKTDIDILLVNTFMCMAVEVKRELDRMKDVDEHLKRMQLIRQYPPEQIGDKQLFAAMAGGVVDPDVKNYAYECGFFVLELTGESVHLVPPPEGFEPRKW
jgi:hypothetical protein